MDYAALVGVHRLESDLSALLDDLRGSSLCKGLQSFAALVAVAVAVDGDAAVGFLGAVACEDSQILETVKSLAASADNYAELIAGDVKNNVSVAADSVNLEVLKPKSVKHVGEVLLRCLHLCAALDIEILGKLRYVLFALVLKGSRCRLLCMGLLRWLGMLGSFRNLRNCGRVGRYRSFGGFVGSHDSCNALHSEQPLSGLLKNVEIYLLGSNAELSGCHCLCFIKGLCCEFLFHISPSCDTSGIVVVILMIFLAVLLSVSLSCGCELSAVDLLLSELLAFILGNCVEILCLSLALFFLRGVLHTLVVLSLSLRAALQGCRPY